MVALRGHETDTSLLIKRFPVRRHESCLSFLIKFFDFMDICCFIQVLYTSISTSLLQGHEI